MPPATSTGPQGGGRARRATDGIILVAAWTGLVVLAIVADPASGFEWALVEFVERLPPSWRGMWQLVFSMSAIWATVIVVVLAVRARWALVRDVLAAGTVAVLTVVLVSRIGAGSWPAIEAWELAPDPTGWRPPVRVAVATAVVMTAAPHLPHPWRVLGRWIVVLSALGAVLSGAVDPSAAVAGLLVGAIGASAAHLVFGSARGWPLLTEVAAALEELGVDATSLRVAARQPGGVFLVDAVGSAGEPLLVKVYGRDAYDTRLVAVLWRSIWYRGPGTTRAIGRLRQVEHEALMTLLAARGGVPTTDVVTAAVTERDDALLVLRPAGTRLADHPERWTTEVARRAWDTVARLHAAGIVHGQVDDEVLSQRDDGQVVLTDLRVGSIAAPDWMAEVDRAQVLVATALGIGVPAAVEVAADALDAEILARSLSFLQAPALTSAQRADIRTSGLDLDELRSATAARLGVDAPGLQQLRRVDRGAVVRLVLLVVMGYALVSAAAQLDLGDVLSELADASVALLVVGFVLGQTPRLSQAVSTLGASPVPLPLGPTYALQLASSFIGLAVPSSAARVAMNIRFLQRHGLPAGSALTVGALDGVTSFVIQVITLTTILVALPLSLELSLDPGAGDRVWRLLTVIAGIAVVAVGAVLVVARWRRMVLAFLGQLLADARQATRGLHSPRRLGLLVGGSLATELLFALTLGAFAAAVGYPVSVVELLLINMSVSLLAGLLPIPGGIGVAEGGLTLGLVMAGVPEEPAFAAVVAYRLTTFYLPPIWGYPSLRWLERNAHL